MSEELIAGARVRRVSDHQIGWVIEDEAGRRMVKLDRREESLVPLRPKEWEADPDRPLAPIQVARICFEADRALRTMGGEYGIKEWALQPEPTHLAWIQGIPRGKDGKPVDAKRLRLWRAIHEVLSKP